MSGNIDIEKELSKQIGEDNLSGKLAKIRRNSPELFGAIVRLGSATAVLYFSGITDLVQSDMGSFFLFFYGINLLLCYYMSVLVLWTLLSYIFRNKVKTRL